MSKLKGYQARDAITHRTYDRAASIKKFKKTGRFNYRGNGGGHAAGERWAMTKGIDPKSRVTRYSKNSPSFDEGVYQYKAKSKALNRYSK